MIFSGRLAILQRVLPAYRAPFFDALAAACQKGLSLYAGQPRLAEAIEPARALVQAEWVHGRNLHLLGGPAYLCWQKGLLRWLGDTQPDALIVEANPRYLSTPLACSWMHRRQRPVLGWGLGAPTRSTAVLRWQQFVLRQFDALITYSQQGAVQYQAAGFPLERIFVARNAVAPHPTRPYPVRSPLRGRKAVLLFVGRLQTRKRLDLLFHACTALPNELQPELIIVGDGPARSEFEALAAQVYPATRFTGALFGAELDALFEQADLFVLPGTGGLAVQQALSFGLPVIVAEADGTQSDLVRPENGWQVPAGDVHGLVRALREALADPERLPSMGKASFRIVDEEINLENMVTAFIQALNNVSSHRRQASSEEG
jgi:glycosyltransferase involved in cell wall biosynthesis